MFPQQIVGALAQFSQLGPQAITSMCQGLSPGQTTSMPGPPTQYYSMPQQQMGVLPGVTPSKQAVGVLAGAMASPGTDDDPAESGVPGSGYVGTILRAESGANDNEGTSRANHHRSGFECPSGCPWPVGRCSYYISPQQ